MVIVRMTAGIYKLPPSYARTGFAVTNNSAGYKRVIRQCAGERFGNDGQGNCPVTAKASGVSSRRGNQRAFLAMLSDSHCQLDDDFSCDSPKLKYAEGGRLFKLSFARSPAAEWNGEQFVASEVARRGKCRGFSFGSRRRMLDRLNSVSCAAENPEMVTLTLPDEMFDDSVARFAQSAKSWLDVWLKRLKRVCPSACGFWRIEWKARKSGLHEDKLFPHFHLLVWGLPVRPEWGHYDRNGKQWEESFVLVEDKQGEFLTMMQQSCGVQRAADMTAAGECCRKLEIEEGCTAFYDSEGYYGTGKPGTLRRWEKAWMKAAMVERKLMPPMMVFRDWCALSWYHVVGSNNVKHFAAGVTVERVRSFAGVAYCAKAYLSKVDAESLLSEVEFGRSWGIFNRALMPWAKIIEMDLSPEAGVRLRRIARRYLEHRLGRRVKRPYGVTLYCNTSQWSRLLAQPPDTPF